MYVVKVPSLYEVIGVPAAILEASNSNSETVAMYTNQGVRRWRFHIMCSIEVIYLLWRSMLVVVVSSWVESDTIDD